MPGTAVLVHPPGARHAQVGVQREVSLEANEQVLAARLHLVNGASRQPLGPAIGAMARMWCEDLIGRAAGEHRADTPSHVMDRVAL